VDSQASIVWSMAVASRAHGIEPADSESVRRIVGLPLDVGIAQLFPELGQTGVAALREGYRLAFTELRQAGEIEEPLYPGTLAVLDQLDRDGWLLGVATGKSHRGLVRTLATHDLQSRFVTLQTADMALGKPHPEMIYNALGDTGVDATDAVMIGDTTFDMEMARNAKVWAVGVAWGYHQVPELGAAGAHVIVHQYGELPAALADLVSR
ncbi:MAG TPA: HAD family hydrolase, partial [Rhodospirillales bacterium]|nr:HAD family hydrolase [Rhodospirillales bacterium]